MCLENFSHFYNWVSTNHSLPLKLKIQLHQRCKNKISKSCEESKSLSYFNTILKICNNVHIKCCMLDKGVQKSRLHINTKNWSLSPFARAETPQFKKKIGKFLQQKVQAPYLNNPTPSPQNDYTGQIHQTNDWNDGRLSWTPPSPLTNFME